MSQPLQLCSLQLIHDWYGHAPAPFRIVLVGNSAKLAERLQLQIKARNGIFEFYLTDDGLEVVPDEPILECEIFSTDPWLIAYTDVGVVLDEAPPAVVNTVENEPQHRPEFPDKEPGKANLLIADIILNSDKPDRTVQHSDWKKTGQAGAPLARLTIYHNGESSSNKYTLKFPTISTYWTYVINAPEVPDELAIVSKDRRERVVDIDSAQLFDGTQFEEIDGSPSGVGHTHRRFRSVAALPAKRNGISLFELVARSTGKKPLVSPLPAPSLHSLPRHLLDKENSESQIFVTVLASTRNI